jgi:hypothetical protein
VGRLKDTGPAVWWAGVGETGGGPRLGQKPEMSQSSKKILFEFQLIFLEFGRTLKNCIRRFRWNFDMGILSKIF